MYGFHLFSVQGNFKAVGENGKEENTKELFLTESANFTDAETTVLKLLLQSTSFPDSIDVPRISRMDKVDEVLYSDMLEVSPSLQEGFVEYGVNKQEEVCLYAVKVQFEEEINGKICTRNSVYMVPARSASGAERHLKTSLGKTCVSDFKITDVNATKFDTVVLCKESHSELVNKYDQIKHLL